MPKINIDGWSKDKERRAARIAQGLCPMCATLKRAEDEFCSDPCKESCAKGVASKESP